MAKHQTGFRGIDRPESNLLGRTIRTGVVWIDFLERRFQGKQSLFGLARESEKEIINAIVEEGGTFWERDAHEVNADLAERIGQPPPITNLRTD
ncbi:MAG: hypothetical protein R3D29_06845 [Nitratireductor sp.]